MKISIAKDFSTSPGGRYIKDGPNSGEKFREKLLKPQYMLSVEAGEKLVVNFDGCYGFPSSFIDESFGGLARELGNDILNNIVIISNDQPSLPLFIKECVQGKSR